MTAERVVSLTAAIRERAQAAIAERPAAGPHFTAYMDIVTPENVLGLLAEVERLSALAASRAAETPPALAEIRERAEKATPGPWETDPADGAMIGAVGSTGTEGEWSAVVAQAHDSEDAEFIAHARDDVPLLLAEVERLSALAEQQQGQGE